jgi:hypothetical protein
VIWLTMFLITSSLVRLWRSAWILIAPFVQRIFAPWIFNESDINQSVINQMDQTKVRNKLFSPNEPITIRVDVPIQRFCSGNG